MAEQRPQSLAPGITTQVKWIAFRALEWLADQRTRWRGSNLSRDQAHDKVAAPQTRSDFLWVFVSTIGELNAIEPLIRQLHAELPGTGLLLLSDREHYRQSYAAKFPSAQFAFFQGGSVQTHALIERFPPRLLLLGEIPCQLSDAPCRFSFAALFQLKRYGVPVCVVNGWLYGYAAPSRMDQLERALFARDYVRLIDLYVVQTDDIARELIRTGAQPERVLVGGNIKFDQVQPMQWSIEKTRSSILLSGIVKSARPCIVAGCVTNLDDQTGILDAYLGMLREFPTLLLVLAPRHPENTERMQKLDAFLRERSLRHAFRTRMDNAALADDCQVLVLDTIGELKDFYAVATLTYVGPNHNVLEPLAFGKPVFVLPGWEKTYPSYPVYQLLRESGGIVEASNFADLAGRWSEHLREPGRIGNQSARSAEILASKRGATSFALRAMHSAKLI